jgi:hypothetical protein
MLREQAAEHLSAYTSTASPASYNMVHCPTMLGYIRCSQQYAIPSVKRTWPYVAAVLTCSVALRDASLARSSDSRDSLSKDCLLQEQTAQAPDRVSRLSQALTQVIGSLTGMRSSRLAVVLSLCSCHQDVLVMTSGFNG